MDSNHVVPEPDVTYTGVVRFVIGVFPDADFMEPTFIACRLSAGDTVLTLSKTLSDILHEQLGEYLKLCWIGQIKPSITILRGVIYEWEGTLCDGQIRGKIVPTK